MPPHSPYDVIEVKIVGLPYHDYEEAAPLLRSGCELLLSREPDNAHDENAIAAYLPGSPNGFPAGRDLMLGYVARNEAAPLAPIFDNNGQTIVTVLFKAWQNNADGEQWLTVSLDLRDIGGSPTVQTSAAKAIRRPRRPSRGKDRIEVWL